MQLLLIRHGIAVEQGTPGMADDDRPLTEEGVKKFRKGARGLARVCPPPDALLSSPLPRAHRTAELAAEAWGGIAVTKAPALASGDWEELKRTLARYPAGAVVVLVGHEPSVSQWLARLLGTDNDDRLAFKKGGAALVDVPGGLEDGGSLVWYLPPKVLRDLAG